jgi:sugar/nucleoside kinase (ribokinase family)
MSRETQQKDNAFRPTQTLDYLVVGHLTADMTDSGIVLGGTPAFSGLTAQALGLRTGIITSAGVDLDMASLNEIWLKRKPSEYSTTFKNISDGVRRTQYLYHTAEYLNTDDIPDHLHAPAIVHLGPVANEVAPDLLTLFPKSLKCMTPQGWFRKISYDYRVELGEWENWEEHLSTADIAVISQEDVRGDEDLIAQMVGHIPIFAVTENYKGARIYWHGDARYINAPEVKYVDDTGAGDIFATAFFYRYFTTKDPWEAGRFAVKLASWSVTRQHLNSIPTPEEIQQAKMELIEH